MPVRLGDVRLTKMKQLLIYTDGGSRGNPGPAACAFVVCGEGDNVVFQSGKYLGRQTNNFAEYCGVEEALKWLSCQNNLPAEINFKLDSLLVVNQLNGIYKIKNPALRAKIIEIRKIEKMLNRKICFRHIKREGNALADSLLNKTLDQQA